MNRMGWIGSLLAVVLILSGCSQYSFKEKYLEMFQPESSEPAQLPESESSISLRLPVNINDSLNPYDAQTQMNRTLLPLLYDSLVKVDEHWQPVLCLASQVETQGQMCTVTVREDVRFSNGSPLTAQDVLYSLQQACADQVHYPQLAALVESAAVSGNTLTIQLTSADQNFANLLTFPIIAQGTREEPLPPGTGRFLLSDPSDREMEPNSQHFEGTGRVERITLVVLPDDETVPYSLKTGIIDCVFSDRSSPEVYGMSHVSQTVAMTNLVYLGMNQGHELLGQADFRVLLNQGIYRDSLAGRVYSNRAQEAYTPFPTGFWQATDRQPVQKLPTAEFDIAMAALGLEAKDGEGYRLFEGERVSLRLVVQQENDYRMRLAQELVESFSGIGIELVLVPLDNDSYFSALQRGDYDLFLAEIKLGDNLDLTPVLSGASVGVVDSIYDLTLLESYGSYLRGEIECSAFLDAFENSYPFLPLLYRSGTVSYSHNISANILPTSQDIFYNLAGW